MSKRVNDSIISNKLSRPGKIIPVGLALIAIVTVALGGTYFYGCAGEPSTKYVKDGKAYGVVQGSFRHRWWNYYERALSFAEGEFYNEAVADLQQALKQREADQRNARTYGMHFVDYFPHRELGVVYYHQEKYDDAEVELKASLDSVDTGKAKHYLNLVRKVKLELSQADKESPKIKMASVPQAVTNHLTFEIKGEVKDDKYARRIVINETPEFIELSAPKIPFSKKIKLKKGLNEITIKTADLLGKETEKKIRVVGDFEVGPLKFVQMRVLRLEFLGVGHHCPEFVHAEAFAAQTGSGLREQDRPRIIQVDR